MAEVVVKGLRYDFQHNETYNEVKRVAENEVAEQYEEEQQFQNEEFEESLKNGDVADYEEYKEKILGFADGDIDYSKTFSENKEHPLIDKQISELTNKYMSNVCDLPRNVVIAIYDTDFDAKGKPSEKAVQNALKECFGEGVKVLSYDVVASAEKKDILSQSAYEKVGELIKSGDFKTFLDLRASIGKYSSNNVSLIYSQMPTAKAVMGFNAWKKLERHVDAGQTGIAIWQPCKRELKTEKQVDDYIAKNKDYYGNPDSSKAVKKKTSLMQEIANKGFAEIDSGFRLGTTFDISQTVPDDPQHDNLGQIINLNKPLNKDISNYDAVLKSMKDAATIVRFVVPQEMSQQDALFEAVLQYADNVLSNTPEQVIGIKSNTPMKGDVHTIETVMAAQIICSHIGIECSEKAGMKLTEIFANKSLNEDNVKIGKRGMFTQGFDRACKLADQFTKEFDKSFGCDLEAQREAIAKSAEEKKAKADAALKTEIENRVYFGTTPMNKIDEWKQDNNQYFIGQNKKTGSIFAKVVINKKNVVLNDDAGKPLKFNTQPSRDEVVSMLKAQLDKAKTNETQKEVQKTER